MVDTVLSLINDCQLELGLPVSSTVVAGTDLSTQQLVAHMNAQGREVVKEYYWSALLAEPYSFSLIANQELYPVPADFDRIVPGTAWDLTNRWPLLGPDNPQTARWLRDAGIANVWPRRRLRQMGANISIWPIATASGDVMHFDYVSKNWAVNGATGLPQSSVGSNNTDTTLFNSDLMRKGTKWRFMAAKGMSSAAAMKMEHDNWLKMCIAADMGGGRTLTTVPKDWGNADFVVAGAQPIGILQQEGGTPLLIE